jgi:hypothetical protein
LLVVAESRKQFATIEGSAQFLRLQITGIHHTLQHAMIPRLFDDAAPAKAIQTRIAGVAPHRRIVLRIDGEYHRSGTHLLE